ncbi:hypothetical protein [Bradyrhizobium sp. LA7.1]|uniref:hypothetical protein n=1 Tax=Bradyrhizobium sp. LA7.1 TaxID=3156324 RepID=UPI003392E948
MATKSFDELLKALNEDAERDAAPRQRLLVKANVLRKDRNAVQQPAAHNQALGLLLKSAINDAVVSGRLSGTSAMAGLRALGLED